MKYVVNNCNPVAQAVRKVKYNDKLIDVSNICLRCIHNNMSNSMCRLNC